MDAMNAIEIAASDTVTDAELDEVNGGFIFILAGAAVFSTGFFAGYGAVRFIQDMSK
jgi:hypothetical protein